MRRCARPGCGVILKDTDQQCPVCGGETVDAGSGKMEKQSYDEPSPVIRRRRGGCCGVLIAVVFASVVLYVLYERILASDDPTMDAGWANRLIDMVIGGPKKK